MYIYIYILDMPLCFYPCIHMFPPDILVNVTLFDH